MNRDHQIYRVTGFEYLGDYRLRIQFSDDTEQEVDFRPVLTGPLFSQLLDKELFRKVQLVEYAGCLEWPNGADFDPETLHDWPEVVNSIVATRKQATPSS